MCQQKIWKTNVMKRGFNDICDARILNLTNAQLHKAKEMESETVGNEK